MTPLTRITLDPDVMGGKPCIRGLRIAVGTVVGLVEAGRTSPEILAAHPYLEEADIREARAFRQIDCSTRFGSSPRNP